MFSPPLYTVRKFPLKYLIDKQFDLQISKDEEEKYIIKQQDNLLFRQIRLITGNTNKFNKYITFIDCKGGKSYEDELSKLVVEGYKLKSQDFEMSERSASMTRTAILSYIDSTISDKLDEIVSLGVKLPKTVLSKYYAYRGLMLSSCHCLENWYPKIVIVPDYMTTIKNQKIKYVYDNETEFIDKNGNKRKWKQKDIAETIKDIEINAFDGCGIHHPKITEQVQKMLNSKTRLTSILWRAPFIKGVTHEIDYETFFEERGVEFIKDIWGVSYSIHEPMIIMTESMYKGKKYFQKYKDIRDWEDYWHRFKKYNHCIGIAKWNFSIDEEPIYTRGNYQILQDLQLDYEDFALLAKDSIDWISKIIDGDPIYTYCFLGMIADKYKPLNNYCKAILKNPEMLKEYGIRNYLITLLEKYKNEMKCGKLWLKSCFKFLAPDLIMLLEYIGGLEPKGCLESNQFYSFNNQDIYHGEYLIERNPHICKSEHVILNAINNDLIQKYCSHLSNVCMINSKSITPQRLNGADFDGDLVLVVSNKLMMKGVDKNAAIVMDIDDKITSLEEDNTKDNRLKLVLRTMNSLIGETSNCATGYHNKMPKSIRQKQKYDSYVNLLSVINGKAIDFAKTGVLFNIPRNIAKYSKPLPYFMKYASEYYSKQHKFSYSRSNMNRLCWEIEKWEKSFRWKRTYKDFDYSIMIDKSIKIDEGIFDQIEIVYLDFCKEMAELAKEKNIFRQYNAEINWQYYYNQYRKRCNDICKDQKTLANIAVKLCYEKYPNKNKKFMWRVAGDGIVQNIKQANIQLPKKCDDGEYKYLGKKYNLVKINMEEFNIDK